MGLISAISPAWALNRRTARNALNLTASVDGGGFEGAKRKPRFKNWRFSKDTAQNDVNAGIETLRDRSRDLDKNDHIAHGALSTKLQYVVGGGLLPEPAIDHEFLGLTNEAAEIINAQIKRYFLTWANDKRCDFTEQKNFFQKQAEVYHSKNRDGDAWCLLPWVTDAGFIYNTRLHTIDPDRISTPKGTKDSATLMRGLELDSRGRVKKLHISKRHPGAGRPLKKDEWQTVNYKRRNGWPNVLHLAHKNNRAGQITGTPDLAPVIGVVKQLGQYIDAELLATIIANKFTVFVKSSTPGAAAGLAPGGGLNPINPAAKPTPGSGDETSGDLELGDGLITQLDPDEDISIANPARPNPNFGPFIDKAATHIGSALGIPSELLLKHFTASYSASKAALLMFANFVSMEQLGLVRDFCRPVYDLIIDEAVATGRLVLPGYMGDPIKRAAYLNCYWHGAPIGEIDELKAANAALKRMEGRLTNRTIESRRHGHDADQVRQGLAAEQRKDTAAGLIDETAPAYVHPGKTNAIDDEE